MRGAPRFIRARQTPWSHVLKRPQGHVQGISKHRAESGFSLVELLIVIVVLPLVVGAITLALMSVLNLQGGVSNRLSDSSDAQVVSANFVSDVQGASLITTAASPTIPRAPCSSCLRDKLSAARHGSRDRTNRGVVCGCSSG